MAFGAQAALLRQAKEGGSWLVRVSLAQTAHWLRGLGRIDGTQAPRPDFKALLETYDFGYGKLVTFPHAAKFSRTRTDGMRPSMPPGSHAPAWPV